MWGRRRRPRTPVPEPVPVLTAEDRAQVAAWVADEVARLRAMPYVQLLALEDQELHCERLVPSGAYVLRETGAFIDDDRARTLRVYVDARQPQSGYDPPSVARDDFIMRPDGSFVGE